MQTGFEPTDWLRQFMENQRRYNAGQSVVEYAGALIIAVVLVSLALAIFPTPFTNFFFESIEAVMRFIQDFLPQ